MQCLWFRQNLRGIAVHFVQSQRSPHQFDSEFTANSRRLRCNRKLFDWIEKIFGRWRIAIALKLKKLINEQLAVKSQSNLRKCEDGISNLVLQMTQKTYEIWSKWRFFKKKKCKTSTLEFHKCALIQHPAKLR